MQYMYMIYMYLYKRYVGDPDMCICCIAPVQNPVPLHLAFASARLVALRRLVAGQALDFEEEVGSICICILAFELLLLEAEKFEEMSCSTTLSARSMLKLEA